MAYVLRAAAILAAGLATGLATGLSFGQVGSQLEHYQAANEALPPYDPLRVVFFGDSITDNWAKPALREQFFVGKPYVDRGISGQTSGQMVLRFQQDVVRLHPAVVVILAGTNDVAGNSGAMTPQMTEDNLATMVDLAKAHGIRPILCSILPAADFPWHRGLDPAPRIRELNAWIKEYALKEKVDYVDYYSALANDLGGMKDGTSMDGVHPNAAGYRIMEPLVEKAIANGTHTVRAEDRR